MTNQPTTNQYPSSDQAVAATPHRSMFLNENADPNTNVYSGGRFAVGRRGGTGSRQGERAMSEQTRRGPGKAAEAVA